VHSLFLFDKFFILLKVTELPAILRAERITSLVVVVGVTLSLSLVSF
jgi:hypothetical protein